MRERPILFSSPMVRAILSGSKTQTRRVVKPKHEPDAVWGRDEDTGIGRTFRFGEHAPTGAVPWWNLGGINGASQHCPYGVPGDRLWVRESLTHVTSEPMTGAECSIHCYTASVPPGMNSADPYGANYLFPETGDKPLPPRNVPSIHMPRWASRITLEVTGVRVERLQEISEADAKAEGCCTQTYRDGRGFEPATLNFERLWNQINGAGSWEANPFVWCISFRRIEQEATQ